MVFGVDNFMGDVTVTNGAANYKFWDPEDASNTAEVSVSPKDYPNGATSPDSREVSDYAYAQVAEGMVAKRSDRIKAAAVSDAKAVQDRGKVERAASLDHFANVHDGAVAAAGTETRDDGTKQTVYNTAPPSDGNDKKNR